jgi:hypothetical protein
VHDHLPGDRVLPTGTLRFWFDVWSDNPQLDGGSFWGTLNQTLPVASWQILHENRPDLAILWLQALGTDAVIAPEKTSFEPYRDYKRPEKFRGAVPAVYDDGHGTVIYRIPRVHPGLARLVDSARMKSIGPIRGGDDFDGLTKYVAAIEDPANSAATVAWNGFDEADIHATAKPGQSVILQETWDPAWHAYANGREVPVRVEPAMDFMLIDVPAGANSIRMRFETPLENRLGQVLFVLTAIGLSAFIYFRASPSSHASSRG